MDHGKSPEPQRKDGGLALNSKRKGTAAENELAQLLTIRGIPAQRNEQGIYAEYWGGYGNPDILAIIAGKELHIECKRTEKLRLYDAIRQAERDCAGRIPIVAHRKNRDIWRVDLALADFLTLTGNPTK